MRPLIILLLPCACTDGDKGAPVDFGLGDSGGDTCEVRLAEAAVADTTDACAGAPPEEVVDPWEIEVEWFFDGSAGGVVTMPAVGNLTDDNGDGLIDNNDTPDALAGTYQSTLLLLDGGTGAAHWELTGYLEWGGTAIADVDADGDNDAIAVNAEDQVTALDGDGELVWQAEAYDGFASAYPEITVADLEGDGLPEVIVDRLVLNGEDGSVAFELDEPPTSFGSPVAADLDLDGHMEILLGGHVYDDEGALLWEGEDSENGTFNALANVDDDDEAEVLLVNDFAAYLYDHGGHLRTDIDLTIFRAGVPCAGDLNGDGAAEFAIPSYDLLYVVDGAGDLVWQVPILDTSSAAGCSVYDFDADGAAELLYADETDFFIFDGTTGEVLYKDPDHDSETLLEYPVIADIDGDGSTEVLVASNEADPAGIRAYGQKDGTWPAAGPGWPVHDYAGANVLTTGQVVSSPTPSWLTDNLFRGRPPVDPLAAVDLSVTVNDWCVSACASGALVVAFQVSNGGTVAAPAGVPVTLYAVSGETRFAVQTVTLAEAIPVGSAAAGQSFTAALSYFGPEGFVVAVNDDGAGEPVVLDCDRANDQAAISGPLCE